jgi:hypothetical protein
MPRPQVVSLPASEQRHVCFMRASSSAPFTRESEFVFPAPPLQLFPYGDSAVLCHLSLDF